MFLNFNPLIYVAGLQLLGHSRSQVRSRILETRQRNHPSDYPRELRIPRYVFVDHQTQILYLKQMINCLLFCSKRAEIKIFITFMM
jgi:hypothetical protein